ncbi:MAG TPA: YbaB/EbfC family nucleoid-associated protein [Amycolatopsis sp.]|nr:YbaB/EbfC family nucleoid-associated protein [Amycolatopsis sp.]
MTDPFAEKNAALIRQAAGLTESAQRYQDMREGLAKVSVTESSPDGVVTVTVDASGLMTDLRIEDRGDPRPGKEIAAAVLSTLRRAHAQLPARAAEVIRSVENDPAAAGEALAGYRERFPELPATDLAEPAGAENGAWGVRTRN